MFILKTVVGNTTLPSPRVSTLHEKFVLCISSNMYQIYENACVCNYFYIFPFHLLRFDSRLPIINDQIYVGAHT